MRLTEQQREAAQELGPQKVRELLAEARRSASALDREYVACARAACGMQGDMALFSMECEERSILSDLADVYEDIRVLEAALAEEAAS